MFDSRTDKAHSQNGRSWRSWNVECKVVGYSSPEFGTLYRQAHQEPVIDEGDVEPFTLTAAYLAPLDGDVVNCEAEGCEHKVTWDQDLCDTHYRRAVTPAPRMVIEHFAPATMRMRATGTVNATKRSRVWAKHTDENKMRVAELAKVLGLDTAALVRHIRGLGEYVKDGRSVVAGPVATRIVDDLYVY